MFEGLVGGEGGREKELCIKRKLLSVCVCVIAVCGDGWRGISSLVGW